MRPITALLNTTIEIWPVVRMLDSSHAIARAYPSKLGDFPARLQERSGGELADERKAGSEISAYVYLEPTTPIHADDLVRWRGKSYHVIEPPIDTDGMGHHLKVGLKAVLNE